jgi:hypothetical protein
MNHVFLEENIFPAEAISMRLQIIGKGVNHKYSYKLFSFFRVLKITNAETERGAH